MEFNEPAGTASPPAVENGYRAGQLLGAGRTALVWLAVRESDGTRFALKISAVAAGGPGTTFETRRELNILSRFGHENLLPLHTVLETDQGPGLLMEWAPGGSLAEICRVRGTLQPGEAVTVLVGIASALAYLHALGVSHGDVSPGNILFTANGKPLLADLGTAQLFGAGAGTRPAPEADVFALASVGWLVLTGRALPPAERRLPLAALTPEIPPALAEAIDAGLQEEVALRPDAAEFARLVFAAAVAQPLELASAEPSRTAAGALTRRAGRRSGRTGGRRRRGGERRGTSAKLLLAAAAVLVAGSMGLGAVAVAAPELLQGEGSGTATDPGAETETLPAAPGSGGRGPDPDAASRAGPPPETAGPFSLALTPEDELRQLARGDDPVEAARALAELRTRAFGTANADLLEDVNTPRSPAMEADRTEIAKLEAAGTVLSGLAVEIVSAGPALPREEGRISVRATVSTSGYTEREAAGGMIRNVASGSRQEVVLVMLETTAGWRIEDVLAPPA